MTILRQASTVLAAIFFSIGMAFAQTVNISSLSPEEQAAIKKAIEAQNSGMGVSAKLRTEASAWADLGTNMGKATVAAAHEVGVAANEFASTPLGKITLTMVAYKIVGKSLIGLVLGVLTMAFFAGLAIWFVRHGRYLGATYELRPVLFGLYQKRFLVSNTTRREDDAGGYYIAGFVSAVIGLLVGSIMIFSNN